MAKMEMECQMCKLAEPCILIFGSTDFLSPVFISVLSRHDDSAS